ncbi:MAG: methyltransferase domain-containing protein [Conexivisphaerales archaeon]
MYEAICRMHGNALVTNKYRIHYCRTTLHADADNGINPSGNDELYLRNPLRRLFHRPTKIFEKIGLSKGDSFLDAGAGFGYFSLAAARVVGPSGLVYAVEPEHKRAVWIKKEAEKRKLDWLVVLEKKLETLDSDSIHDVDKAMMHLSLHHMSDKLLALNIIRRKLKEGGTIIIVEPRRSRSLGHGSEPENVIQLLAWSGYEVLKLEKRFFTFEVISRAKPQSKTTNQPHQSKGFGNRV